MKRKQILILSVCFVPILLIFGLVSHVAINIYTLASLAVWVIFWLYCLKRSFKRPLGKADYTKVFAVVIALLLIAFLIYLTVGLSAI